MRIECLTTIGTPPPGRFAKAVWIESSGRHIISTAEEMTFSGKETAQTAISSPVTVDAVFAIEAEGRPR